MEVAITRKSVAALMAMVLTLSLTPLLKPDIADAAEMQATSLSTQASTNYLPATAAPLTLGQSVSGEFVDYKKGKSGTAYFGSGYLDALEHHWYAFQTTGRNSVYKVRVDSLSGDGIGFHRYDADVSGYWMDGSGCSCTGTSYTSTLSGLDRNALYYIELDAAGGSGYNYAVRYARYKLTVTEHPVITNVTGVKVVKRNKRSLTFKWDSQANATHYQVKYKVKGWGWKTITTTENEIHLNHLKKGVSCSVKVRPYCKGGYSKSRVLAKDYYGSKTYRNEEKTSDWGGWSEVKKAKTRK